MAQRTYPDDEALQELVNKSTTWSELTEKLGRNPLSGGSIQAVKNRVRRRGLNASHLQRYNSSKRYSETDLQSAVAQSSNWSEVVTYLGCAKSGSMYASIRRRCDQLRLDSSHFDPHRKSRENLLSSKREKRTLDQLLVKGSRIQGQKLKKMLIAAGIKTDACETSGCPVDSPVWLGKQITLHLDHIDGDHDNNELVNLRVLCPNCHTQTPTYGSKKRYKVDLAKKKQKRSPSHGTCSECGKSVSSKYTRCKPCSSKAQPTKIQWPPLDELLTMIEATSYSAVGRDLGVSDNAVRKHIRNRT